MSRERIKYKAGYKYQLVETHSTIVSVTPEKNIRTNFITLLRNGLLTIKKGYAWDGPSGPTRDTKNFMRGSLPHDGLYQLMRMKLLSRKWRLEADREIKRMCLEDGMSTIRAGYVYRSLRVGGASSTSPKNRKKVLVAP